MAVGLRWGEVLVGVVGRRVEVDVERVLALIRRRAGDRRGLICEENFIKGKGSVRTEGRRALKGRLNAHAFGLRFSDDSKVSIPFPTDVNQHLHSLLPTFLLLLLLLQKPRSRSKLREPQPARSPPSSSSSFRPRSTRSTPSTSSQLQAPASQRSGRA